MPWSRHVGSHLNQGVKNSARRRTSKSQLGVVRRRWPWLVFLYPWESLRNLESSWESGSDLLFGLPRNPRIRNVHEGISFAIRSQTWNWDMGVELCSQMCRLPVIMEVENPRTEWGFIAKKITQIAYFYGPSSSHVTDDTIRNLHEPLVSIGAWESSLGVKRTSRLTSTWYCR